jgi:DNA-binding transcriptional regulator YdaS (Cro superfamily)
MESTMSPCELAKDKANGPAGLAKALTERGVSITSQAVSQWKRVPVERVLLVEEITGISRHVLRPDVYGSARAAKAAAE